MEDQKFPAVQAGEFCIGVLKTFCISERRLTNRLLSWGTDAFELWKDNQPISSMDALTETTLPTDYTLGGEIA